MLLQLSSQTVVTATAKLLAWTVFMLPWQTRKLQPKPARMLQTGSIHEYKHKRRTFYCVFSIHFWLVFFSAYVYVYSVIFCFIFTLKRPHYSATPHFYLEPNGEVNTVYKRNLLIIIMLYNCLCVWGWWVRECDGVFHRFPITTRKRVLYYFPLFYF